ncbi:MAG: hypothetical protein AAF633_05885 [Chloroflexota bacterium]
MSGDNTLDDKQRGEEQGVLLKDGRYVDHLLRKQRASAFDRSFTSPSIDQKFRYAILNKVETHWNQAYSTQERMIDYHLSSIQNSDQLSWDLSFNSASHSRSVRHAQGAEVADLFSSTDTETKCIVVSGGVSGDRTLVLLDLLFEMIQRAKTNTNSPIPLYFNLSSWARKPMPLVDWLVEEGLLHYQISRYFMWDPLIAGDQIALILDGFDEIDPVWQDAAATALKQFQQSLYIPFVVASKSFAGSLLEAQLPLSHTLTLQNRLPTAVFSDAAAEADQSKPLETDSVSNFIQLVKENHVSRFAIEQVQPDWLNPEQTSLFCRILLWLTGGLRAPIMLPDEISFYKTNFRPFAVEVLRGIGIGMMIGLIMSLFVGFNQGLTLGLVCGLAVGYLFGFEKLIKIDRVHPDDRPNRGIWGAARNSIKGGIVLSILLGLTGGALTGLVTAFAGVEDIMGPQGMGVLIGGLLGLVAGLIRYGGVVLIRHYVVRYELARSGKLPAPFNDSKLISFLDTLVESRLLRRAGGGWVLR